MGIGISKFGRSTDRDLKELAFIAIRDAIRDAGIDRREIGFIAVANMGVWSSESLPAVTISEYCGLSPVGSMRVEAACASGSAAVRVASQAVTSGEVEVALAVGVERMSELPTEGVVELIGRAGNYLWEFENFGLTFPGYYALYASAYLAKFGATEEDLAEVAVKNHHYGSLNPYAQFQNKVSKDDVMRSKYVAWPIKLLDSSPITDGAAAVVIASEEMAKKLTETPVWIRSQGVATGTSNLSRRENLIGLEASSKAASAAYKRAGLERDKIVKQIDLALVHDCFTIAEIMAYEDLGFARRGEGFILAKEGQTYIGGVVPVNLDGGLKAKGHPIAATGVSMAVEAAKQLRIKAEKGRQADIRNGVVLTHNVGGTGHYAYVTIYSLDKG